MICELERHIISNINSAQVFLSSYPILQVHISKYKNKVTNFCAEKYVRFENRNFERSILILDVYSTLLLGEPKDENCHFMIF